MHPRTNTLLQLMDAHDLTIDDVSALLNRTRQTVWSWRCATSGRPIPEHTLELLQSRLVASDAARAPATPSVHFTD